MPTFTRPDPKMTVPPSSAAMAASFNASTTRPLSASDSSDDELPAPMKFSALTKALLNDEPSVVEGSPARSEPSGEISQGPGSKPESAALPVAEARPSAPERAWDGPRSGSPPALRRVVRLSGSSAASVAPLRRSTSTLEHRSPQVAATFARDGSPPDLITPAPRPRTVHIKHGLGPASLAPISLSRLETDRGDSHGTGLAAAAGTSRLADQHDSALRHGPGLVGRTRHGEDSVTQGSLRIKRMGKVSGSFLSGPARRGRRRPSEEEPSPVQDRIQSPAPPFDAHDTDAEQLQLPPSDQLGSNGDKPDEDQQVDALLSEEAHHVRFTAESPAGPALENGDGGDVNALESTSSHAKRSSAQASSSAASKSSAANVRIPFFRVPPPPTLPYSSADQENEPPATFKRATGPGLYGQLDKFAAPAASQLPLGSALRAASLERRPLGPRSQNTPRRPAPPPPAPKTTTVLDTAPATAGAGPTQSKKRRSHVLVNGKTFTRLDCIGRGGSSRVYRVMAENYKVFALKKVALEDVDEITIRGYKGEIDLLRKLDQVDRVVKLFDWEVNDEKQSLSVLMEFGESDLNRILTVRMNGDQAKFDISFARYYWKEMLECVQAVHEHGIVHSDLKPANFLLVQGRLKLIDFGIASAIQDDTINVHREQLVGTPNYISPEAIVDTNARGGGPAGAAGKMMKLGKASDVWSLGCILYQMVYGKPPFAHITNPMQRILAIPNPQHVIEYPARGVGDGVPVPVGLLRTLKACLTRDQHQRPPIDLLLHDRDPFLYPDAEREDTVQVSQEVLARVLANVVNHCQTVGIPTDAELTSWPAGFFARIKKALREEGG
ncbi:MAG: Dual-specificity kinase, spindle pole body (SPB) duplication and spindle checkpoint function [Phylliscum demangeonii]|nr:MAG: Dual-specificity kinase, spindle pole body (SPB) duplication and spindle checkpoint function [Phylliscum demangeonii]